MREPTDEERVEFLLEEYKAADTAFWNTEKIGETLRTFYVSIVSAVVGGIGFLYKEEFVGSTRKSLLPAILGISALLLFGWVVLQRAIRRNLVSHKWLRAKNRIAHYFAADSCENYLMHPADDTKPFRKICWHFGSGGIVQQIALINSLLAGLITMLILSDTTQLNLLAVFLWSLPIWPATWALQLRWVKWKYGKARNDISKEQPVASIMDTHARRTQTMEVETTLAIISDDPAAVAETIGDLRTLGDYHLSPGPTLNLHDRYFDTESHGLGSRKLALRVREQEEDGKQASPLITLKGPNVASTQGGVARFEFEERWSLRSLTRVIDELRSRGVFLAAVEDVADPLQALAALRLSVFQDRRCQRIIRLVVDAKNDVLAELAIDTVTYKYDSCEIQHREVEIELKTTRSDGILKELENKLRETDYNALRPWSHSKLAMGELIRRLCSQEDSGCFFTDDGSLLPAAYEKINELA